MTEEQQDEFHEPDVDAPAEDTPDGAAEETADETPEGAPDEAVADMVEDVDPVEEVPGTGHPAVDEVLRSLDALGDAPVDEHVAVFEQAHEQLRRTLQGAGDE